MRNIDVNKVSKIVLPRKLSSNCSMDTSKAVGESLDTFQGLRNVYTASSSTNNDPNTGRRKCYIRMASRDTLKSNITINLSLSFMDLLKEFYMVEIYEEDVLVEDIGPGELCKAKQMLNRTFNPNTMAMDAMLMMDWKDMFRGCAGAMPMRPKDMLEANHYVKGVSWRKVIGQAFIKVC